MITLLLELELAEAFERVSQLFGLGRRTSFFPAIFEHQRRVPRGAAPDHHCRLSGSKWSCLLLRSVLQGALSEVMKVDPPMVLEFFVDDIIAFIDGGDKRMPGIAGEVLRAILRKEGRKERTMRLRHVAIWKRSFRNAAREKEWDLQPVCEHQV